MAAASRSRNSSVCPYTPTGVPNILTPSIPSINTKLTGLKAVRSICTPGFEFKLKCRKNPVAGINIYMEEDAYALEGRPRAAECRPPTAGLPRGGQPGEPGVCRLRTG